MLAARGGPPTQIRDQLVRDQAYRQFPIGALAGRYLDELEFDKTSPTAPATTVSTPSPG